MGTRVVGWSPVGFGAWHVLDAVLSHWVLGIHRIKLDSDKPLLWDLVWLSVFGLAPLAAGWWLARGVARPSARLRRSVLAVLLVAGLTAAAASWSLRPPPDQPFTTVVFRPGVQPQEVFAALDAADARIVWSDAAMGVVVVEASADGRWSFYRHGALLVSGSAVPAGCFNWSQA